MNFKAVSFMLFLFMFLPISMTTQAQQPAPKWSLVIHGGAGSLPRDLPAERVKAYKQGLTAALDAGTKVLADGGTSVDAVEAAVVVLEDNPIFNAGRGAVFDRSGAHSLDASIMDGSTLAGGGVGGVTTIRNPIRAARLVMDKTPHVLLVAQGADKFAADNGAETVVPSYFSTRDQFAELQRSLKSKGLEVPQEPRHGWPEGIDEQPQAAHSTEIDIRGTVGCVALDSHGHLAAATSTGGLTGKIVGRVGDSPILAAGTFANNHVAVSGTGHGEQYIRHFIAGRVAMLVESGDMTVDEAVEHCLTKVLDQGDGGLIAIDSKGNTSLRTTTGAMPHAVADSSGKREIGLWLDQ